MNKREIKSLRREKRQVFRRDDGQFEYHFLANPKFTKEDGVFVPISDGFNLNGTRAFDGFTVRLLSESVGYIVLLKDGSSFRYKLTRAGGTQLTDTPPYQLTDGGAIWSDVLPSLDVELVATNTAVQLRRILKDATAPSTFRARVQMTGTVNATMVRPSTARITRNDTAPGRIATVNFNHDVGAGVITDSLTGKVRHRDPVTRVPVLRDIIADDYPITVT